MKWRCASRYIARYSERNTNEKHVDAIEDRIKELAGQAIRSRRHSAIERLGNRCFNGVSYCDRKIVGTLIWEIAPYGDESCATRNHADA